MQRAAGPRRRALKKRWTRWSDNGVFAQIVMGFPAKGTDRKTVMIDAT